MFFVLYMHLTFEDIARAHIQTNKVRSPYGLHKGRGKIKKNIFKRVSGGQKKLFIEIQKPFGRSIRVYYADINVHKCVFMCSLVCLCLSTCTYACITPASQVENY